MASIVIMLCTCQLSISETQLDALARTLSAVAMVESGGDPKVVNVAEDAVGILQIRPIMVRDVNRILGEDRYSLADRTDVRSSCGMFATYCLWYWPDGTPEQWSRGWCGGPKGPSKACSLPYWRKVKAEISRQRR